MREVDISADDFEWWLRSHGKMEIVGKSCLTEACPLAKYMSRDGTSYRVTQTRLVRDDFDHHGVNHGDKWSLPDWAVAFAAWIDDYGKTVCGGNVLDNEVQSITAGVALYALAKARQSVA